MPFWPEKNVVPQFRSSHTIAPAAERTGTANNSKIAVMNSDQMVMGNRNIVMPGARMFTMVVM